MERKAPFSSVKAYRVRETICQSIVAHLLFRLQKRHTVSGASSLAVFSLDRVSAEIAAHGVYERASLELLLELVSEHNGSGNSPDVVIDVGAHVGNHTVFFSHYANRVVAFEPNPNLYKLLCQNIHGLRNVEALQKAVTAEQKSVVLSGSLNNLGDASVVSSSENAAFSIEVQAMSLDDLELGFVGQRVSLIKCDVEGAEPHVLKGARKLIRHHRPLLAVEFADDANLRKQIISAVRDLQCNYDRVWWPHNFRAQDSWLVGMLIGKRVSLKSSRDFSTIPRHRLPYVVFETTS